MLCCSAIPSVQTHSQTDLVFVLVHFCGCDIQRILSIDGHVIFMFLQSASLITGIGCDGSDGDSYSGSCLWLEEEIQREVCGMEGLQMGKKKVKKTLQGLFCNVLQL